MNSENVDLVRDVLDHEIVDSNGVPCGMVDDVELSGGPGSKLVVEALLVGTGAWTARLPWLIPRFVRTLAGRRQTRIPWNQVTLTNDRVKLISTAEELGLNAGDFAVARWFRQAP
jgi:sporulation protein YlmC with PRC-barrel domain